MFFFVFGFGSHHIFIYVIVKDWPKVCVCRIWAGGGGFSSKGKSYILCCFFWFGLGSLFGIFNFHIISPPSSGLCLRKYICGKCVIDYGFFSLNILEMMINFVSVLVHRLYILFGCCQYMDIVDDRNRNI